MMPDEFMARYGHYPVPAFREVEAYYRLKNEDMKRAAKNNNG